jgi:hypothetical protein
MVMEMISSEVQRTLVKSPPELWAELSDPESLARHLGELEGIGQVKITRIEPETLVEWEAEGTTGSVAIKASGWGTKVTLKVERELAVVEEAEAEPEVGGKTEAEVETEAEAVPEARAAPKVEAEPEPEVAAEPGPEERRGFLARLFGRRGRRPAPELPIELAPEPEPMAEQPPGPAPAPAPAPSEPQAREAVEPDPPEPHAEQPDLAAELMAAEEQVTAALTAVLDRLGSAHHRPFSRA